MVLVFASSDWCFLRQSEERLATTKPARALTTVARATTIEKAATGTPASSNTRTKAKRTATYYRYPPN